MPKILVTGLYDPNYPRNANLLTTIRQCGQTTEWPLKGRWYGGLKLLWRLVFSRCYHYVIVIQPVHFLLPFLWLLKFIPGRPKIILDAFVSAYDTNISDRQLRTDDSWLAKFYKWLDKLIGEVGDGVFFDTEEHKNYFHLPPVVPQTVIPVVPDYNLLDSVVTDEESFPQDKINVFFYGKYIPLQGVATIVEAAKILRAKANLHLTLLGSGQDFKKSKNLADSYGLTNITFLPRASYQTIIALLKAADLALGVFGTSEKMQRVIPNKVLEALAVGVPIITGESRAVKKFFRDNEHIFFSIPGDPRVLSQRIKQVASDLNYAKQIAAAGKLKVRQDFSQILVRNRLSELLAQVE